MLSKYESNVVSAALKFFSILNLHFLLEGEDNQESFQGRRKEKMTCIEHLPCIRLSKTTVDINGSILQMKNLEVIKQCVAQHRTPSKK